MSEKMVAITVDGASALVDSGSSLLDACAAAGAKVPTLCHLEGCFDQRVLRSLRRRGRGRQVPRPRLRGQGDRGHEGLHLEPARHARAAQRGGAPPRQPPRRLPHLRALGQLRAPGRGAAPSASGTSASSGRAPRPSSTLPPTASCATTTSASSAAAASRSAPRCRASRPSPSRAAASRRASRPSWTGASRRAPASSAASARSSARRAPSPSATTPRSSGAPSPTRQDRRGPDGPRDPRLARRGPRHGAGQPRHGQDGRGPAAARLRQGLRHPVHRRPHHHGGGQRAHPAAHQGRDAADDHELLAGLDQLHRVLLSRASCPTSPPASRPSRCSARSPRATTPRRPASIPATMRLASIMPCTAKKHEAKRPEMRGAWEYWQEKARRRRRMREPATLLRRRLGPHHARARAHDHQGRHRHRAPPRGGVRRSPRPLDGRRDDLRHDRAASWRRRSGRSTRS